jgi:uncharacterized damage-inducible protein DinB
MTFKTQFEVLFAYHWHNTRRLMDLASRLSETDYKDSPGYGHGSIHDLFFHLLRTDQSWRMALQTGKQLSPLRPGDYPDLPTLARAVDAERQDWEDLLAGLSAADIEADVSLTSWRGNTYNIPRWRVLQHLVLHGMQHHAELAHLLTAIGQSPGDLDFIFYRQ